MIIADCMYDYRNDSDKELNIIGRCEVCGCDIVEDETHYNFSDALVCEDHMIEYCYENYRVI